MNRSRAEEEVKAADDETTSDKSSGPEGFTGAFFKACWITIIVDIMAVINQFSNFHTNDFHWLNSANIALIAGAEEVSEFRPISLIHAIAKLISKMMATRLTPHMDKIVANAKALSSKQGVCTTTSFMLDLARKLHETKMPTLLFKLDIKKIDSIRWDYLVC
jgi:hypothetical protein